MFSFGSFKRITSILLTGSFLLAGCSLEPKYKRATPKVASDFPHLDREDPNAEKINKAAAHIGWNSFFTDPRLKRLISLATTNNQDIAAQIAAVFQARSQYAIQNSQLFPSISAGSSAQYQDPSAEAGYSFDPTQKGNAPLLKFYSSSINFSSYEIDLWGRIRNLTKAQKEDTLANAANLRTIWITLVSQIASTYIQWLADTKKLEITRATLHLEHHLFDQSNLNYKVGNIDRAIIAEAIVSLEDVEEEFDQIQRSVEEDEHLLTLLVGTTLPDDLPPPSPLGEQTMIDDLPPGIPSDLLTQRPDIMEAEHNLLAANAQIGAARAAFLPRFSLTAGQGADSSHGFHHMFSKMAETWTISPQVSVPIFTFGQNMGELTYANARKKEMLAKYQKAIQIAFREVSDALTARRTYKNQEKRAIQYVDHIEDIARVIKERYNVGSVSGPDLISIQEIYKRAQINQITVSAARYQNMVTLYRVLGGGWRKEDLIPQPVDKKTKKNSKRMTKIDEGRDGVQDVDKVLRAAEKSRRNSSQLERANNVKFSPIIDAADTP